MKPFIRQDACAKSYAYPQYVNVSPTYTGEVRVP